MTRIALLESNGNTSVTGDNFKVSGATRNPAARYDRGLFQINSQHPYDPARLLSDPDYNVAAAREIYDLQGPQAWSTLPTAVGELENMTQESNDTQSIWDRIVQAAGTSLNQSVAVASGGAARDIVQSWFKKDNGETVTIEQVKQDAAAAGENTEEGQLPPDVLNSIGGFQGLGYSFVSSTFVQNPDGTYTNIGQVKFLDPMGRLVTFNTNPTTGQLDLNNPAISDIGLGPSNENLQGLTPLENGNFLHSSTGVVYDENGLIVSDPQGKLTERGLTIEDYNAQTARQRAATDRELGLGNLNLGWAQLEADTDLGYDSNAIARDRVALDRELGYLDSDTARRGQDINRELGLGALENERDLGTANAYEGAFGNETNRIEAGTSSYGKAGDLTSQLMASIAAMGSDPGSAVEREYLTRGMLPAGTSQSIPISGMLQDIISKLTNESRLAGEGRSPYAGYEGLNPPAPIAPTSVGPTTENTAPPTSEPAAIVPGSPEYQAYVKGVTGTRPWVSENPYIPPTVAPTSVPISQVASPQAQPKKAWPKDYAPDPLGGMGVIRLAEGGTTTDPLIMTGDPQQGNEANPEVVITPPGTPKMVIPVSDIVKGIPRYAFGTLPSAGTSPTVSESLKGNFTTQSNEAFQDLPSDRKSVV